MSTSITEYDAQAIFDNWLLLQPIGDRARAEIDGDPPLRKTLPSDWPAPRAAYRLRSGEQQNLAVLRRVVETVPGARVTVSVSACVQTGDADNPPRTHNIEGYNTLVAALDPSANADIFAAPIKQMDIPIGYDWRGYTLSADATGRQMTVYVGFWWAKENRYHYKVFNGWIRKLQLSVETPETAPPPGPGPVVITAPGFAIETAEDLGDRWRIVGIVPKAK